MNTEPKFVADVMLGSLANYLLLTGFDCRYFRDIADPDLVEHAQSENRILLTRDSELVRKYNIAPAIYYVENKKLRNQLSEIIHQFDMRIRPENVFTRCSECNEKLETVDFQSVQNQIPPETTRWIDTYFQCPSCKKVFWKGTHYQAIIDRLREWKLLNDSSSN